MSPKKKEINEDSPESNIKNNVQPLSSYALLPNGVYCFKDKELKDFEEWYKVFQHVIFINGEINKVVKIYFIQRSVEEFHKNNGGVGTYGKKWFIKHIFPRLIKEEIIQSFGFGTGKRYEYCSSFLENIKSGREFDIGFSKSVIPKKLKRLSPNCTIVFDGEEQEVYLMYFKYSEFNPEFNSKFWRCKIGRTGDKEGLSSRIYDTAFLPDKICYALSILTSDSKNLEEEIHCYLKKLGRQVSTHGKEWFFTNPDEIIAWFRNYEMIVKLSKFSSLNV